MPRHLRGRPLFGEATHYQSLEAHLERGDEVKVLKLSENFSEEEQQEYYTYEDLATQYDEYTIVPLFILADDESLEVVSEMRQFRLRPEDRLVALVGTGPDVRHQDDEQTAEGASPATENAIFEIENSLSGDGGASRG